jgi:hypothetical protein
MSILIQSDFNGFALAILILSQPEKIDSILAVPEVNHIGG